MLDGGDRACAIEVSSHALALGRADAIEFAAAVFTNLTQDHLDFHRDMEDYFLAKRLLFVPEHGPAPRVSVVNIGDPYGRRLAAGGSGCAHVRGRRAGRLPRRRPPLRAHRLPASRSRRPPASARADAPACPAASTSRTRSGRWRPCTRLGGGPRRAAGRAASAASHVPGRFEPVDEGQDFAVLVDYAHTPDSLENVLRAARDLDDGEAGGPARVICVFGAGGDRDRGKRPLMGEIAARLADVAIVTSDNPRSEDPEPIIAEIMAGTGGAAGVDGDASDRRAGDRRGRRAAGAGRHRGDRRQGPRAGPGVRGRAQAAVRRRRGRARSSRREGRPAAGPRAREGLGRSAPGRCHRREGAPPGRRRGRSAQGDDRLPHGRAGRPVRRPRRGAHRRRRARAAGARRRRLGGARHRRARGGGHGIAAGRGARAPGPAGCAAGARAGLARELAPAAPGDRDHRLDRQDLDQGHPGGAAGAGTRASRRRRRT